MKATRIPNEMETRAAEALNSLLHEVSSIKTRDIKFQPARRKSDILADIDVLGRSHRLVCNVADGQPDDVKRALQKLREKRGWRGLDRLIVITDEQVHDGIVPAWTPQAYVVNVAPYKQGVSYGNGWTHVDGWSGRIVDYIAAAEIEEAA